MKNSPNPWSEDGEGRILDANGHEVALIIMLRDIPIIQNAPELLAACRALVTAIDMHGVDNPVFIEARKRCAEQIIRSDGDVAPISGTHD